MSDRIEEIRARWAKATPGPWEALPGVRGYWCVQGPKETPNSAFPWFEGDAEAIAHAPEDIAYLLAELEAARASNESPNHRPAAIDRAVAKLREQARKVVAAAKRHDGCDQYDMDESLIEYDGVVEPSCPCPCQPDDDFCTCPWDCECKQRWVHGQVIDGGQP